MISEIVRFDGGMSTKSSPHLIGTNEGIICENVNLERGSLHPLSSLSYIDNVSGKYVLSHNDELIYNTDIDDERFYQIYGGRVYWSNAGYGSYGLMRYDGTNAGVDAEAPSPLSDTELGYIGINESSEVDGFLTNGASYTYAFTIVDTDGIESTPKFKAGVDITADKESMKLELSVADWTTIVANHPTARGINIYRTGGDNPTFNLVYSEISRYSDDVTEDSGVLTWYDSMADINVSRIELTTFDNNPPISNLDMLIENNGTFFGAYQNKVYFSRVGSPEYWSTLDFLVLDKECTGLGKFGDYIVAFTRTSAYMISGDTRDTIVIERLPFNQGCVNKNTIVSIDAYLVWTSLNGICLFNGSEIQVITKKTLAWDEFGRLANTVYDDYNDTTKKWSSSLGFDITFAVGYQDKYYGMYNDGVVIIDLADGLKVTTINTPDVASLTVNPDDNLLYIITDKKDGTFDVYGLIDIPSKMIAQWKTGRLVGESVDIRKHYRQVELDGMPLSVEVFINGESKFFVENKNKFMLPSGLFGKDIQFEIKTINEIRGLKFQYSTLKG